MLSSRLGICCGRAEKRLIYLVEKGRDKGNRWSFMLKEDTKERKKSKNQEENTK
jgi:hypothetical protein